MAACAVRGGVPASFKSIEDQSLVLGGLSIVLMHTRISSSARIKLDGKVASSLGLNGWRWYTYLK